MEEFYQKGVVFFPTRAISEEEEFFREKEEEFFDGMEGEFFLSGRLLASRVPEAE